MTALVMELVEGEDLSQRIAKGRAIGAGGMGEVFRARDTKLNRDVAIQVLPAAFAARTVRTLLGRAGLVIS